MRIDYQINHAEIIKTGKSSKVRIGSLVTIKTAGGEKTYTILGASETDPTKGIISHQSPLGSTLLGKNVGDVVKVGKVGECEVVEIK